MVDIEFIQSSVIEFLEKRFALFEYSVGSNSFILLMLGAKIIMWMQKMFDSNCHYFLVGLGSQCLEQCLRVANFSKYKHWPSQFSYLWVKKKRYSPGS